MVGSVGSVDSGSVSVFGYTDGRTDPEGKDVR